MLVIGVVALVLVLGCRESEERVDCIVSWHMYRGVKYTSLDEIEQIFHNTFTSFWQDSPSYNTVRVTDIGRSDVCSIALRLAQMADGEVEQGLDPATSYDVTVKVFVNFDNSYEEEIWSKTYCRAQ